ncbi:DUF1963 domain-containing protein [Methylocystis bryophila]|uniref:DUF1963 domain-containing protein n=1 Tax=Methylocystis bryophila TaxID=655015 RepID=A0A1W6MS49_9HYPH|nr:DUF1963 domain-containing protein [Methylocystis bryophila]ARN80366.1 hypothetical protein B1812_03915 [Methylocystis bryophila]BDV40359.1 hypothetical protein DSM21852_36120 [Methylocystis bryophila]
MYLDTPENRELDAFLASLRAPAILLHRPYPPVGLPKVRSRLGGLPCLPDGVDWPIGEGYEGATPLHFLAQIDCSELPPIDARLPKSGMLFFFARDDEEQIWGQTDDPAADGRVIFAPDAELCNSERPAPIDLPPIRDACGGGYDRPWLLPGEIGTAIHWAWPLVALPLDTWPDSSALDHRFGATFQRRVNILRTAALLMATETPTCSKDSPDWEAKSLPYRPQVHPIHGSQFPPVGIFIERTARLIYGYLIERTKGETSSVAGVIHEAQRWMAFGKDTFSSIVPPQRVENFADWIASLSIARPDDPHRSTSPSASYNAWFNSPLASLRREMGRLLSFARPVGLHSSTTHSAAYSAWFDSPLVSLRREMGRLLTIAAEETIRAAATRPSIAEALTSRFFDCMETEFLEVYQGKSLDNAAKCSHWHFEPRFHQMLGHAPSSQRAMRTDAKTVCLLQLATDCGAGMSFGDMGEATFWIKEEDLIERRFDRAWVALEGH